MDYEDCDAPCPYAKPREGCVHRGYSSGRSIEVLDTIRLTFEATNLPDAGSTALPQGLMTNYIL
jgi:hypothetical protein